MEENQNNEKLSIDQLAKEGIREITIRHGDAPTLLDEVEPVKIELEGDINSINEFLKHRGSLHKKEQIHIIMNREKNTILLVVDEKDPDGTTVKAILQENPELAELNINKNSTYTHKDLITLLKFKSHLFSSKAEHKKLINDLRNFTAKLDSEFRAKDDQKGNIDLALRVKAETKINLEFGLKAPLYKGYGPQSMKVEIMLEATSVNNIKFWFESEEYAELLVKEKDTIFDEKKKSFTDYVVIEK